MRRHGGNQETLLLLADVERDHEALHFHVLAIEREDVLRELRRHLAALLDRLHLRERLPRHDARTLRQDRTAVVGRRSAIRFRARRC